MLHIFILTLYLMCNVVFAIILQNCSDEYNIGEKIAGGAQAKIMEATPKRDASNVVIKVFNRNDEFEDELEVYSRIMEAHKSSGVDELLCFAKTFGVCKHENSEAIVMERLEKDLVQVLASGPTFLDNVFYTKQILECVDRLHQIGFVHQDLKLNNIMLSYDGKIKICDFGSAVQIGLMEDRDANVGHAMVAAPESVMLVDGAKQFVRIVESDVWALGLIVHSLFVGNDVVEKSMGDIIFKCIGPFTYPRIYVIPYFIHKCIFATGSKLTRSEETMLETVKKTLSSCCLFRLPIRLSRESYQHCDSNHWLVKDYERNLKWMDDKWKAVGVSAADLLNVHRLMEGLLVFDSRTRDTVDVALMNPLFNNMKQYCGAK